VDYLTLNPLTWKIWWARNKASRWQMGFNSAFKGLTVYCTHQTESNWMSPPRLKLLPQPQWMWWWMVDTSRDVLSTT